MLESQRDGIAKAKREGRYKGRVPTARRQAAEIIRLKQAGHQALGNRQQAGDWSRQRLSGISWQECRISGSCMSRECFAWSRSLEIRLIGMRN